MDKRLSKKEYLHFFKILQQRMLDISDEKTDLYGAESIGELGSKGEFLQIHRKYTRLKQMLWKGSYTGTEKKHKDTLKDTLIDMANSCLMTAIVVEFESCEKEEKK